MVTWAHCRWRARQIIKNIPPSAMGQIRAKVAAMEALGGLRKDWGCQRAWARDYLSSVRLLGWGVPRGASRGVTKPYAWCHPSPTSRLPTARGEPGAGSALRPPPPGSQGQGALWLRPLLLPRP